MKEIVLQIGTLLQLITAQINVFCTFHQVTMINRHTVDIEASENLFQSPNLRSKRAADILDELLMVQTIKIHDKFGFRGQSQSQENAINRNEVFNTETNTVSLNIRRIMNFFYMIR